MAAPTPTGHTILGLLASHPRSGYEIRRAAARTPFWGVSDGQLYPQLRRLAADGLIEPDGPATTPHGKQVWRVTGAGRAVLREWLAAPSAPVIIRDENLVKLMFAARVDHDAARSLVAERRHQFTGFREWVEEITPAETWAPEECRRAAGIPELLRTYGLAYCDTALSWCDLVDATLGREGTGE